MNEGGLEKVQERLCSCMQIMVQLIPCYSFPHIFQSPLEHIDNFQKNTQKSFTISNIDDGNSKTIQFTCICCR